MPEISLDQMDTRHKVLYLLKLGVMWDDLDEAEQGIVRVLDRAGLATPRADIKFGLWQLKPAGLLELERLDKEVIQHAEDKAYNNLKDERENEWKRKDARRSWIHLIISIVVAAVSFILGVLVDVNSPVKQWVLSLLEQL